MVIHPFAPVFLCKHPIRDLSDIVFGQFEIEPVDFVFFHQCQYLVFLVFADIQLSHSYGTTEFDEQVFEGGDGILHNIFCLQFYRFPFYCKQINRWAFNSLR